MRICLLLVATALCGLRAASGQESNEPLQGNWIVVRMERGGRAAPEKLLKESKAKVTIRGNTLRMSDDKRGESATFKIDPDRLPKQIDLVFLEGPDENVKRTAVGIYELHGESLTLAWRKDGGQRPTAFASIPDVRTSELMILKRAKE